MGTCHTPHISRSSGGFRNSRFDPPLFPVCTKKKQLQKAAALVPFQPQGKGPHKRTPRTILEQQQLANEEFFEPEKVLAESTKGGALQFEIKWKGFSQKFNSWEPLVNLPGSEDLIRLPKGVGGEERKA